MPPTFESGGGGCTSPLTPPPPFLLSYASALCAAMLRRRHNNNSYSHPDVMIKSMTYTMTSYLTSDCGATNNFLSDDSMNYVSTSYFALALLLPKVRVVFNTKISYKNYHCINVGESQGSFCFKRRKMTEIKF